MTLPIALEAHHHKKKNRVDQLRLVLLRTYIGILLIGSQFFWATENGSKAAAQFDIKCSECNVVLISIDTLRADHLGCYGYHRKTSPAIDKFAQQCIRFEQAYSTSYVTAESHMSMFTSLYPSVHGIKNVEPHARRITYRLSPKIVTLPELLKLNGYSTRAITGGGNVSAAYGFDRGMDQYMVYDLLKPSIDKAIQEINRLKKHKFFLFYHTYHVHDPYTPQSPYNRLFDPDYKGKIISNYDQLIQLQRNATFTEQRRVFWSQVNKSDPADIQHLVALYDGEIREVDVHLNRLLKAIKKHAPNTIIILTSDHGEEFGEHGRFLHNQLYNELLHVPLLIYHPLVKKGIAVSDRISLISLAPTILGLLDISGLEQFQGSSLVSTIWGEATSRPIYAEKVDSGETIMVEDFKIITSYRKNPQRVDFELYDVSKDQKESLNIYEMITERELIENRLRFYRVQNTRIKQQIFDSRDLNTTTVQVLDNETREQLRALGYLE